jgi:hypothetical protein
MHASNAIDEMILRKVAPFMKEHDFRKQRYVWWRANEDVIDVIDIQKSRWNDASGASFTVNLGLYWPTIQKAISRESQSKVPRIYECTVSTRLGPMFDDGRDFWWKVSSPVEIEYVGSDVCTKLLEYGLPWISAGHDLSMTLEFARKRSFTIVMKEILAELERHVGLLG